MSVVKVRLWALTAACIVLLYACGGGSGSAVGSGGSGDDGGSGGSGGSGDSGYEVVGGVAQSRLSRIDNTPEFLKRGCDVNNSPHLFCPQGGVK